MAEVDIARMAQTINDCVDAIERSKMGPIFARDSEGKIIKSNEGIIIFSHVNIQVLLTILQQVIPKDFKTELK